MTRLFSIIHKQNLSKAQIGRNVSIETRTKIAKKLTGTKQSAETIAKRVATIAPRNRGQKRTDVQKQNISKGTILAMRDPEVRRKVQEGPRKWLAIPANREYIRRKVKEAMTDIVRKKISINTKKAMMLIDKSILNTVTNPSSKAESKEFYKEVHIWLKQKYGAASNCENRENQILIFACSNVNQVFDWANRRDKPYEKDRVCFYQLCQSCHRKYDRIKV